MTEETVLQRFVSLFTEAIPAFLSAPFTGGADIKILKKVRPVIIVGRNIAEGQAFDAIIGTNSRLNTNGAFFSRVVRQAVVGNAAATAPGNAGEIWAVTTIEYRAAAAAGAINGAMQETLTLARLGPTRTTTASTTIDLMPASGLPTIDGANGIQIEGGDADDTYDVVFGRIF